MDRDSVKKTALTENQTTASEEDFFLPDLCKTRVVFALVLITELMVLVEVLAGSGASDFDWDYLALASLFVQWIMLSSSALLCLLRNWLSRRELKQSVMVCFGVVGIVTIAFTIGAKWMVVQLPLHVFWLELEVWSVLKNLLVAIIITGLVLRYLYVQHELHRQQRAELQARLQSLQSRIHPHFLFNSMNSIASLIAVDPDRAEQAVVDLSELFRASLQQGSSEVTIAHEIALCRQYLRIEQLRLGNRLKVEWQLDDLPETLPIPLLTLQPLFENAIYHGVQPLSKGGTVTVAGEYRQGVVTLRISNPVLAGGASGVSGNRIALVNIEDRLRTLYGGRARVVRIKEHQEYMILLSYPCKPIAEEGCG